MDVLQLDAAARLPLSTPSSNAYEGTDIHERAAQLSEATKQGLRLGQCISGYRLA